MKRSFSLVAVLAVVVAIASAFATKERRALNGYFVLVTPVTQSVFSSNYATVYKDKLTPYTQVAPQTDDDIALAGTCPSGSAKVCAVRYPGYTTGNDVNNLDITGISDFPATAPSSMPDIIFRSN